MSGKIKANVGQNQGKWHRSPNANYIDHVRERCHNANLYIELTEETPNLWGV